MFAPYAPPNFVSSSMSHHQPWFPTPPGPSSYYNNTGVDNPPSNSRELRNRAEKMRRDKLNSYISELASLVPLVARSAKRLDKTSILRLTATHLRIHHTLQNKDPSNENFPKQLNQYVLEQLIYEQMGGFLIVLLSTGKIVFVSPIVEQLLGHLQTDLLGQSLYNITAPEDHRVLKTWLEENLYWKKSFIIKLKRAGPRSESSVFEHVKFMGMQKTDYQNDHNQNTSNRRETSLNTLNSCVFVFFARIYHPEPSTNIIIQAAKEEYVTRHLIDGRIIGCDQRISVVAGYMTDEVSGTSAFTYMHREDVRWVIAALRQMYDKGETRGDSCYRLLSKNGEFIYLQTSGFLEIDSDGTVESFVCVNKLVSQGEGNQLIQNMKKKFAAFIGNTAQSAVSSTSTSISSPESVTETEDPGTLKGAIIHLITNLPGSECSTPSSDCNNESQDCSSMTDYFHKKSYHMKIKTATKRSADPLTTSGAKKQKTDELMHAPAFQNGPQITEIPQHPETPIYEKLLHNQV